MREYYPLIFVGAVAGVFLCFLAERFVAIIINIIK